MFGKVQQEHNAHVPPIVYHTIVRTNISAKDLASAEQEKAQQREIEKQVRLEAFRYAIRSRVAHCETNRRQQLILKEKGAEASIKRRVDFIGENARYEDTVVTEYRLIPTTSTYIHNEGAENVQACDYVLMPVSMHAGKDSGNHMHTSTNKTIQDVVDAPRLYASVRAAAMGNDRERARERLRLQEQEKARKHIELLTRMQRIQETDAREEARVKNEQEQAKREAEELQRVAATREAETRAAVIVAGREAEGERYLKALKKQLVEHMAARNIVIVPICPCSKLSLSHDPRMCYLNCIYFNKPAAYRNALEDLLRKLNIDTDFSC